MMKQPTASNTLLRAKSRRARIQPQRIVILDDEPNMLELHEMALRYSVFRGYERLEILTFTDSNKAMDELLRADPDLLITDWNHTGIHCEEMFEVLAAKKIRYPILVITASAGPSLENQLSKITQPLGLRINLQGKPSLLDDYRRSLVRYFHLSP